MIRPRTVAGWVALLSAAAWAPEPAGAASAAAEASVTYVTSATVYVDCGTEAGLRKGDVLKVFRGDEFVTALEVAAISSRRASCPRSDGGPDIRVGDRVRFFAADVAGSGAGTDAALRAGELRSAPAGEGTAGSPSLGNWLHGRGMRGRIGLRYLGVYENGTGGRYDQPALDVRLEGSPLSPDLRFSADVRTRRTYRSSGGESSTEGRTRVYRFLGEWSGPGGFRTVAGRQYSTALASVGIFDGLSLDYTGKHWSAGAFSGVQPDVATFSFSTEVMQHGGYLAWRGTESGAGWQLTLGAIGSYEAGEISREKLVFQTRFVGSKLLATAIQDVDVNRGWKHETGAAALAPTSTFLSVRYDLRENASLDGGFDNRKNVRLYRDRITPETEFDDGARQGVWAGLQYRPGRRSRLGVNVREITGGAAGAARSVTLTANTSLLARHDATAGIRSTGYRSDVARGWLHSATTGFAVGRVHTELTGGYRRDAADGPAPAEQLHWWGVDTDLRLSRAWMILVSAEASRGDLDASSQVYVNTIYRF